MKAAVAAALLASVVPACAGDRDANTPDAVAERFLDLYLIEIDQAAALELTSGVARERLEQELRDVAQVRATGYSPSAAKPRVYYEQVMLERDAAGTRARAIYDIRIRRDDVDVRRHVLLSLGTPEPGRWTVTGFTFQDGPAARR